MEGNSDQGCKERWLYSFKFPGWIRFDLASSVRQGTEATAGMGQGVKLTNSDYKVFLL
jgi:hypothetical protein